MVTSSGQQEDTHFGGGQKRWEDIEDFKENPGWGYGGGFHLQRLVKYENLNDHPALVYLVSQYPATVPLNFLGKVTNYVHRTINCRIFTEIWFKIFPFVKRRKRV